MTLELFLNIGTFAMTACPISELQEENLVPQNHLLLSLLEGSNDSHICLRKRHEFGSFILS